MSHEFIQWAPKCTNCLVKACCVDYRSMEEANEIKNFLEFPPRSLALPKYKEDTTHSKMLIECLANMLFDAVNGMDKIEMPREIEKNNNLPMGYVRLLVRLSNTLQWVVNSTSWKEGGELHLFDKMEVKNMLKFLAEIL